MITKQQNESLILICSKSSLYFSGAKPSAYTEAADRVIVYNRPNLLRVYLHERIDVWHVQLSWRH